MRIVYFNESQLIKRGPIGLGGFMEMSLTINRGQKISVMWDILVVYETIQSLMFLF